MVLKIKNKHHSTFRLLSSSRSYRVTFEKILFTFYTKSFTISSYIYFITLEKYYTIHLTMQVKKYHWSFYKILLYRHFHNQYPNWFVLIQAVIAINSIGYISKIKLQESIVLYIQPLRYHCFQDMSPVVFPFVGIFRISLINKDNGDVIQKTIVTPAGEVFK